MPLCWSLIFCKNLWRSSLFLKRTHHMEKQSVDFVWHVCCNITEKGNGDVQACVENKDLRSRDLRHQKYRCISVDSRRLWVKAYCNTWVRHVSLLRLEIGSRWVKAASATEAGGPQTAPEHAEGGSRPTSCAVKNSCELSLGFPYRLPSRKKIFLGCDEMGHLKPTCSHSLGEALWKSRN